MKSAAAVAGVAIAGLVLLAAAAPARAKEDASRTITVRLAVDRAIPNLTEWRFQANSFLEGAVRIFRSRFGIKLAFKGPVRWRPVMGAKSLQDELRDLTIKVDPDGCDIVLGIVDLNRVGTQSLGIASYVNSCIVVGNTADPGVMRYAVLHEICHVFGAIDLGEKGSLMSVRGGRLEFDKFTDEAVLLHRDRTFSRGSFPLPQDGLDAAIKLYGERADRRLGEPETNMFLTLFYLEKNDLESASRAGQEAARQDPDMMGLEVLLGNISLCRGEPALALGHYERAMERQPADPGLHYNVALAYASMGKLPEAAGECREALRIDPDLVPAQLGLARLIAGAFRIPPVFSFYRRAAIREAR